MGVTIKQKGLKPPSTPKKIQKNKLPPRDYHGRFITKGIYLELSPPDRDEKGRFYSSKVVCQSTKSKQINKTRTSNSYPK